LDCGCRPSTILSWAHDAFNEGEFDEADLGVIRDVVARLGLADVAAFGLTPLPRSRHALESRATELRIDLDLDLLIHSASKEVVLLWRRLLQR